MRRVTNKIIAGRFRSRKIKNADGMIYVLINGERLELTPEIVDHVRILGALQNKSFISGLVRGILAKLLGNTAWLSAIQSAKSNYDYNVKIVYRDGSSSVVVINFDIMEHLAASYEVV